MKNANLKAILAKLEKPLAFVRRYLAISIFLGIFAIYGFLIVKINGYNSSEPSEDAVTEKVSSVNMPRVDKKIVDQIRELEDNNVEVKSLFEETRENPFKE